MVVAGRTAVARLVSSNDVGIVVEPWSAAPLAIALAQALTAPDDVRAARRRRARAAALDRYNWETEQVGLVELYRALASSVPDVAAP